VRRLPAFLAALAFPAFRALWAGAFVSSIGTWTQDVALSWLIHERYHDPFYLGLRQFSAEAPLIAFMALGGAVADRIDRRLILLTSQFVQMAMAAALGLLYATDHLGIAAIVLIAFLTGLAQSQSAPTYQAVLTSIVPAPSIPNAVALNSLQFNLSRFIGPTIAAFLLARVGTGPCFLVNALSFLAVIAALWSIRIPLPAPTGEHKSLGESLRDGFRHLRGDPMLSRLTLLALLGSFFAFPLLTFLPVIADLRLGAGAAGYSLLLSSFGLGAIVGAITTAHRGKVAGRGRLLLVAFAGHGLLATAAMASRLKPLTMVLLFASGVCVVTAFSTLNSLVQEKAPEALRGRVLSLFGLAFRGGGPLGGLLAGVLVKGFGAPLVLGAYSMLLVGVAAIVYGRSEQLRAA
jgi:predicted MFS family arabinose efflux permease